MTPAGKTGRMSQPFREPSATLISSEPELFPSFSEDDVRIAVETIKFLSVDGVQKANSGHPGTPMGLASVAFEIFVSALRHDPKAPHWRGRDRFVLSCGHASMLLYSMLHLFGYDISLDDLKAFRQWGSKTPGHPEVHHTPGAETTTGPLGQGIGNAVGFALAAKMMASRYGERFASRTFVLASDGDVMEGVSAEASSLAGHLGLGGLVVFYDDNKITIDGSTDITFTEDVGKRYEAYGWFVQTIDGHDHAQIRAALSRALEETERPSFLVTKTHIGHGAPTKQDTAKAHGSPLGPDEIAAAKKAVGWDPEKQFHVPERTATLFSARARVLGELRAGWDREYATFTQENPQLAAEIDARFAGSIPADLYTQLRAALPQKPEATRSHSGALMQKVAELVPWLVGGAADLVESTKTEVKNGGGIQRGSFAGRNVHYGIREHAMGAISNGLALSGAFLPFGSTFLIFSDYMRPSIRLSALMELPCLWLFTHDSVMLGEDGPTHQPVEQLASLRLIPNTWVFRPADALEVAACWTMALGRRKGPSVFALSRQKVPELSRPAGFDADSILRGGYVLSEPSQPAQLVLIATGAEVAQAVDAAALLGEHGCPARVVSVPCLEAFEAQDLGYQESVLPTGLPRVSIELGRSNSWTALVGDKGLAIGLERFGASAPDKVLLEQFGFTPQKLVEQIQAWRKAT